MKIIYFSPVDWNSIVQRPQHLASCLSHDFDFVFIQPMGLRNIRLSDIARIKNRIRAFFADRRIKSSSLIVKNLLFVPLTSRWLRRVNILAVKNQIRKLGGDDSILWVTSPSPALPEIVSSLQRKMMIYEMLDDYPAMHPERRKEVSRAESELMKEADLIIATSRTLYEKAVNATMGKQVALISNGVDHEFFRRADVLPRPEEISAMKKVAGYVGAVDTWMDLEMISYVAERRPHIDFVFVGPVRVRHIPMKENVHFLGKRDYSMMPSFISGFDVCLIPFYSGSFADSINPVKLYEYFALGKPVVASYMKELAPYSDLIYMGHGAESFLKGLDKALTESEEMLRKRRLSVAIANDWSRKAEQIKQTIGRLQGDAQYCNPDA